MYNLKLILKSNYFINIILNLEVIKFIRQYLVIFILYFPLIISIIPLLVLTIRLIKFHKIIRFALLEYSTFGHCLYSELYLCERDLGFHNNKIIDIFYTIDPAINKTLLKKFQTQKIIFPENKIIFLIDLINRCIPSYQEHIIYLKSVDYQIKKNEPDMKIKLLGRIPIVSVYPGSGAYSLLINSKSHFKFSDEEKHHGETKLIDMGLTSKHKYICFHARDKAYKNKINTERDWSYHDYRDANIQNYLPMANILSHKGFHMIRMGSIVAEKLKTNNPKIIDYPYKYHSEFMDFYLAANCQIFITGLSGACLLAILFRKPIIFINSVQIQTISSSTKYDLFIPKKMWLKQESRFLTLKEMYSDKIVSFDSSESFKKEGIELVENTAEEIIDVVLEMENRLNGNWETTEEEIELQKRYQNSFANCIYKNNKHIQIGTKFIKDNIFLLD